MTGLFPQVEIKRGMRGRLVAAAVLVLVAVLLIVVVGRSDREPRVEVAVTTESWPQGAAGGFVLLEVPERLSPFFLTPDQLTGLVAKRKLEAGVFLSPPLLRPENDSADDQPAGTTRVRLQMETGLWPAPGPVPGDQAVIAGTWGSCGIVVLELLEVEEGGTVTVNVTPELAARLSSAGNLTTWPPTAHGWPLCQRGN